MNKYFFSLLIISFVINGFSQTLSQIEAKIDSLEKVKQSIISEKRILEKKEERTNNLIKIWKDKKLALTSNNSSNNSESGITAKVVSEGGSLRDRPLGSEKLSIPGGASITVLNEFSNLYFKVVYKGNTGYLSYSSIQQNAEVDMLLQAKLKNPDKVETTSSASTSFSNDPKYKRIVEIYGKDISIKIMNKEVWKGMSPGMLMESLGNPLKMTEENTPAGKRQVWHYSNKYVYIQNGSVTEWKSR
jgi:hypothetical protein